MSALNPITDATFAAEVLACPIPVLVDYWADWCAPCRQLSPVLEELASQFAGQIKFCSLDTNENPTVTAAQGIRTLPTVHIFVGGEIEAALVGSVTKMKLRQALEAVI